MPVLDLDLFVSHKRQNDLAAHGVAVKRGFHFKDFPGKRRRFALAVDRVTFGIDVKIAECHVLEPLRRREIKRILPVVFADLNDSFQLHK